MNVTFFRAITATIVIVAAVSIAERYDERIAWLLALCTIFAILFSQPSAATEIQRLFRGEFGG